MADRFEDQSYQSEGQSKYLLDRELIQANLDYLLNPPPPDLVAEKLARRLGLPAVIDQNEKEQRPEQ